jgi:hypothetical protein
MQEFSAIRRQPMKPRAMPVRAAILPQTILLHPVIRLHPNRSEAAILFPPIRLHFPPIRLHPHQVVAREGGAPNTGTWM